MPGNDRQVTEQKQSSVSSPWAPAQPMLMNLLNKYGNLNTDVTTGQKTALDNLQTAASGIPNFGDSASDAAKKLFGSSTDPQVGMLQDAYDRIRTNLGGTASGANLDPYATPGFSDAIARMTNDITNKTKSVYAGSGRDPSGAGSFAGTLSRGLTEGIAPTIAAQFNQNANRMDAANQTLFNAGGSTASNITNQNQVPLTNAATGVGMLPQIAQSWLSPALAQIGASDAQFSAPFGNLQKLLGPLAGIAGLGGQTSGTGTSTTMQPQSTLSNVLGGVTSGIGLLSMLSDKRAKKDIEPIGKLNDGQDVVRFRYKAGGPMRIGLLAQDVAKVAPEAVENIGGMLHVDHGRATERAARLPGYADGGRPRVGLPAIVGEEGPEIFVPDVPGTVVPNPGTVAARYRDRVAPLGRSPEPVVEMAPEDAATMVLPGAVGVGARLALRAPKIAAGMLAGTGLMSSAGEAGEQPFKWSDPNEERRAEIARLNKQIEIEAGRVTKSAPGTQKARIDGLTAQLNRLIDARDLEQKTAFDTWREAQAAKAQAERPFREEYPNAYRNLPLAGWAGSTIGGLLGARGGSALKSFMGGAIGGMPLSAAAAVGPTAYDAATLPTGSKHQAEAVGWLQDPSYWAGRVGPEIGVGALLGGTAGKYGSQVIDLASRAARPFRAGASATPAIAPPVAVPPVSPVATSAPARSFHTARDPATGRFVSRSASPMSLAP